MSLQKVMSITKLQNPKGFKQDSYIRLWLICHHFFNSYKILIVLLVQGCIQHLHVLYCAGFGLFHSYNKEQNELEISLFQGCICVFLDSRPLSICKINVDNKNGQAGTIASYCSWLNKHKFAPSEIPAYHVRLSAVAHGQVLGSMHNHL